MKKNLQENKKMTLKEMIKEELKNILKEGMAGSAPELDRVPSNTALKKGRLDVELEELYDALRSGSSVDPKLIKQLIRTAQMARKRLGEENYAEGRHRKSFTDGLPRLQGTAKEIDDLIGAAIDAHMAADRFAEKGATDFATHMDRAVSVALGDIEPLLAKMNRIAIEKTMPHLAAAKSSAGEERLMALGKAKDALVPR